MRLGARPRARQELGRRQRKAVGRGADLVARQQRSVTVEQRVFQRLGGQRRSQLLEAAQGQRADLGVRPRRAVQPPVQQFQQGRVGAAGRRRQQLRRAREGGAAYAAVGLAAPAVFGIAAVDGKCRQHGRQRAVDGLRAPVAGAQVLAGDARQAARQRQPFRRKVARQHAAARGFQLLARGAHVARQGLPEYAQRRFGGRGVQQRADLVHEVVAGGAVRPPARVRAFFGGQDFPPPHRARRPGPGAGPGGADRLPARPARRCGRCAGRPGCPRRIAAAPSRGPPRTPLRPRRARPPVR